jgi:hypothetical protein
LPLILPPFVQYQAPIVPLRGLWNNEPAEGDYFVSMEVDWLNSPPGNCVQFALSGNSPVAISQLVALAVDNSRCGASVDFIFSDSGFVLTVPARSQLVAPVFTNALMFYSNCPGSVLGDVTVFQALNSMPPPVAWAPSQTQNHEAATGIAAANASTPIIPAPTSGTVNTISITADMIATTAAFASLALIDGTSALIWVTEVSLQSGEQVFPFNLTGLSIRFNDGLNFVVSGASGWGASSIAVNVYYSTP